MSSSLVNIIGQSCLGQVWLLIFSNSQLWFVYREKFAFVNLHKLSIHAEAIDKRLNHKMVRFHSCKMRTHNISTRLVDTSRGFVLYQVPTLAETYELPAPLSISALVTIPFTLLRSPFAFHLSLWFVAFRGMVSFVAGLTRCFACKLCSVVVPKGAFEAQLLFYQDLLSVSYSWYFRAVDSFIIVTIAIYAPSGYVCSVNNIYYLSFLRSLTRLFFNFWLVFTGLRRS